MKDYLEFRVEIQLLPPFKKSKKYFKPFEEYPIRVETEQLPLFNKARIT